MGELSKLPNIGKTVEKQLEAVGIHTVEDLRAAGSREAWLRIKAMDPSVCINRLYALEGALRGVRWHDLDAQTKREWKAFYDAHR